MPPTASAVAFEADMTRQPSRLSSARIALAGIVAAALCLRIAIVGIGPLIDPLRRDLAISHGVAGLLTTIPFACMSVFAFSGAYVVARIGFGRLIELCLFVLALATVVRACMPSAPLLLLMTVPIGIATALAGVALPSVVKHGFAQRGGAATGAYVGAMGFGAAIASVTAVPLAHLLGGWRAALAATALPILVAIPLWRRSRAGDVPRPRPGMVRRPPWRTCTLLALVFGLQSICFTGTIAWVAPLYAAHGLGDYAAGATPALLSLLAVPFSLLVPGLSDGKDRRWWILGSAVLVSGSTFALALAPAAAPWLWLGLFAIGDGPLFPLTLALPLDVARDATEAGALSTWTLGLGFALSALGPVLVGLLRDLSGGFELPLAVLASCALGSGLLGTLVHPRYGRSSAVAAL
jgi:CP family cyanate transporter-like MFS transporter